MLPRAAHLRIPPSERHPTGNSAPTDRPVRPRRALMTMLGWLSVMGCVPVWAATQGIEVPVVVVGSQSVGQGLEFEGKLEPVKQSTLSAQTSGRIAQMGVKPGDRVRTGQVLAVVDDRMSVAGVSQAQSQVAQADANLANARAHAERSRDLHNKGFISKSALDQAEAQYKAAVAGAQGAQAGQTQSQVAQGYTRLTAPYDGWVLSTHAEAGDLAMPGSPVLTVYAPQPMRAVVHVPASRLVQTRQARQVEVRLPDGRWVQPLARTALPAADPVSQTVEWRLELPPTAEVALLPGQPVQVRFVSEQASKLTVPADAVFRRGELSAVYVVSEHKGGPIFALRAVRTGASHGAAGFEVLAGLRAGDKVAVDPIRAGLPGARPAP